MIIKRVPVNKVYQVYCNKGCDDTVNHMVRSPEDIAGCPVTGVHMSVKRAGVFFEFRISGYAFDKRDEDAWVALFS